MIIESVTFEDITKYRWYDSFLWVTWILPIQVAFLICDIHIQRICCLFSINCLFSWCLQLLFVMLRLPQSWNTYGSVGIASKFSLLYYGTCVIFSIWHSFEYARWYACMIAEIRQLECIHSSCHVGPSWCFDIQCNTVHVSIIHLQYYCHRIIVGLQIKVRTKVLLNSFDIIKLFLDIGKLGPIFFW